MRIATVVGARPQFIKCAPVARALADRGIEEIMIHTGQHYDRGMSDVFFDELAIPVPARNLGIGSGSGSVPEQMGRMLGSLGSALTEFAPDRVVVYGDTTSTLAAALAAAQLHLPLAHVEAGLRSFNRDMPEELNRVLTDHVADLLFAPTRTAVDNLHAEGIAHERVHQVGDVMFDAATHFAGLVDDQSQEVLEALGLTTGGYVLATVHRAANADDPHRLEAILAGLRLLAADIPVVLPLHPRTRRNLPGSEAAVPGLRVIDPVGYLQLAALARNASVIATDSGGLQKEAFFYRVPCVTLREETEWVELLDLGWNRLCPPVSGDAVAAAIAAAAGTVGRPAAPYGDGHAAERIADILVRS
jgi:UDP-GlcNAc3NAcA epimerase